MKIDVEGFEMEVLAGARETIRRNRPVIFLEIMGHIGYGSAGAEDKAAIESRIHEVEKMGYKATYLTRVLDKESGKGTGTHTFTKDSRERPPLPQPPRLYCCSPTAPSL